MGVLRLKRSVLTVICIVAVLIIGSSVVCADNTVPDGSGVIMMVNKNAAYVDGKKVELDVAPVIKNDRTYVPLRFCAEALSADVKWIEETQSVVVKIDNKIVEFYIGSNIYKVDGKLIESDAEPFLENDKTMLPIRFLAEAINKKIEWHDNGIITISVDDYSEAGLKYWESLF